MFNALEELKLIELKAFVTTYESGSFAVVAQQYGKHATTYSRRVGNLEIDLGVTLFERNGGHLVPTEDATSLYHPAKSVLNEVEHFRRRVQLCFEENESYLKVAIDSSLSAFAPEFTIAEISKEFPATEIEVLTGNTEQVIEMVLSKQADMGLALSNFYCHPEITTRKLFDFRFIRVMSPDYAKSFGLSLTHPLEPSLIRTMKQIVLAPINRLGVEAQNYGNHLLHVDSFQMAKSLAINGAGWTNLPLVDCLDALDSGDLVQFEGNYDYELEWSVNETWLVETNRGPVARRLVQLFRGYAARSLTENRPGKMCREFVF